MGSERMTIQEAKRAAERGEYVGRVGKQRPPVTFLMQQAWTSEDEFGEWHVVFRPDPRRDNANHGAGRGSE